LRVNAVPSEVVLVPKVQFIVPKQLEAVKTVESPRQSPFLEAVIIGFWPKKIDLVAVALQDPTEQVTAYEVVAVGFTLIEVVVALFPHSRVPPRQLLAVNVAESPRHNVSKLEEMVGTLVATFMVTGVDLRLGHAFIVHVAV
jgi:hypothetical protein